MSALYKELSPDERQRYIDISAKNRTEVATHRAAVKPAKVSTPRTAYLLFCGERIKVTKAADATVKFTDMLKSIGKQWRSLSEPERQLLKERVAGMQARGV